MSELVERSRAAQQGKTIQQMLSGGVKTALDTALAERIGVERFMQAAVTTFRKTPGLARCTEESILGGLFVAAQLGLEVGGPRGLAYLVPYGQEATFVLGYKGAVELFYRTGQVKKVDAFLIREGDVFEPGWDLREGRVFKWVPGNPDGKPVGAVAYVVTTNGGLVWEHMTEAEILKRRPSRWTNTPWSTWPDQMWMKTVLKALTRKVRMSADDLSLQLAIESDETVQRKVPGLPELEVSRLPVGTVAGADEAPAAGEEDDWEARERAEHDAWLASQEAMDRGGEAP